MFRKRKNPTPNFRMVPPYNAMTGERADLVTQGISPHVAIFQVIEADTHVNYVVCRGFDPTIRKFVNSINVAKPYDARGTYNYIVGHVLAALKPITRLGETPGVASVSIGCPADLDETIEILLDDNSNPISWLDVSGGPSIRVISGVLDDALPAGDSATMSIWELEDGETDWVNHSVDSGDNVTVFAPAVMRSGSIIGGKWVESLVDDDGNMRVRWSECP